MNTKTIDIDGSRVDLTKFSPSMGLPILSRLQNMLGGSVLSIAGGAGKDDSEQLNVVADAIDDIVGRVEPEKITAFVQDILTSGMVAVDGKRLTHIDDLAVSEDKDPYYLALMITKEQLQFSFGGFIKKLMGGQVS